MRRIIATAGLLGALALTTGCLGTTAMLQVKTDGTATFIQPKDVSFDSMEVGWDPASKTYRMKVKGYSSSANVSAIKAQGEVMGNIVGQAVAAGVKAVVPVSAPVPVMQPFTISAEE